MKSVKKILKNSKHIAEGIKNKLVKDERVEEIAKKRYSLCKLCKHLTEDKNKCYVPGECCDICGCNLQLKTRSLDESCALWEIGEKPLWEVENDNV